MGAAGAPRNGGNGGNDAAIDDLGDGAGKPRDGRPRRAALPAAAMEVYAGHWQVRCVIMLADEK